MVILTRKWHSLTETGRLKVLALPCYAASFVTGLRESFIAETRGYECRTKPDTAIYNLWSPRAQALGKWKAVIAYQKAIKEGRDPHKAEGFILGRNNHTHKSNESLYRTQAERTYANSKWDIFVR